jgi:hypothetical protein
MEIINVEDFITTNPPTLEGTMENISAHCHSTPSDEIAIYAESYKFYLVGYDNKVTYPKVTYVSELHLNKNVSLSKILPDLKKVGYFSPDYFDIDDFGKIQEIDYFAGMYPFLDSMARNHFNIKTKYKPIGDKMFRITSKKGSWDIKINDYN